MMKDSYLVSLGEENPSLEELGAQPHTKDWGLGSGLTMLSTWLGYAPRCVQRGRSAHQPAGAMVGE